VQIEEEHKLVQQYEYDVLVFSDGKEKRNRLGKTRRASMNFITRNFNKEKCKLILFSLDKGGENRRNGEKR
jgi:hypothetical protein